MKKIYLFMVVLLFAGSLFAQKNVSLLRTYLAPEIDGFVEYIWECSKYMPIDVKFRDENPSLNQSVWQALYDENNFYCVVFVDDDNHWPGWKAGGNSSDFDRPEFYWDVNEVLEDGVGASKPNSGHYQFAPGFTDSLYDLTNTQASTAIGSNILGGTYAYSLIGTGYVYEIAIPWVNMPDKNGNPTTFRTFERQPMGFDITIVDQDEGITTSKQRMSWNNSGAIDECWNNMDGAGIIVGTVCGGCEFGDVKTQKSLSFEVFPTIVSSNVSFLKDIDRVELFTCYGRRVKMESIQGNMMWVTELPHGIYIIKAYNNGEFEGVAKIIKN
jgi:hypothetical protein